MLSGDAKERRGQTVHIVRETLQQWDSPSKAAAYPSPLSGPHLLNHTNRQATDTAKLPPPKREEEVEKDPLVDAHSRWKRQEMSFTIQCSKSWVGHAPGSQGEVSSDSFPELEGECSTDGHATGKIHKTPSLSVLAVVCHSSIHTNMSCLENPSIGGHARYLKDVYCFCVSLLRTRLGTPGVWNYFLLHKWNPSRLSATFCQQRLVLQDILFLPSGNRWKRPTRGDQYNSVCQICPSSFLPPKERQWPIRCSQRFWALC